MGHKVVAVTGKSAKELAQKLEDAMNDIAKRGGQILRLDPHGKNGYIIIAVEPDRPDFEKPAPEVRVHMTAPPDVPSFLRQILEGRNKSAVATADAVPLERRRLCEKFMALIHEYAEANSKASFEKSLPNAMLRALKRVGVQHTQELSTGLGEILAEHYTNCDGDCMTSYSLNTVLNQLNRHIAENVC